MKLIYVFLMILFYGVYLVIGALIFQCIEESSERERCEKTLEELKKFNMTEKQTSYQELRDEFSTNVTELVQIILNAAKNGVRFDSNLNPSCARNWAFQSAFFFAGTVITTIGYGNIAPATSEGQLFCIFFAVIGLPLFGIMFNEIGKIFANFFRRLECKLRKFISIARMRYCCVLLALLTTLLIFFILIPSCIFVFIENWAFHDAFYYSFITLTTIGFGDFVAGINPDITYISIYKIAVYFWVLFGLAFMAAVINVVSDIIKGSAKGELSVNWKRDQNYEESAE